MLAINGVLPFDYQILIPLFKFITSLTYQNALWAVSSLSHYMTMYLQEQLSISQSKASCYCKIKCRLTIINIKLFSDW